MSNIDPENDDFSSFKPKRSWWPIVAIVIVVLAFIGVFWYFDIDPTGTVPGGLGTVSDDFDLDALDNMLGGGGAGGQ